MNLIVLIFFAIVILLILLFSVALRIQLVIDSDKTNINMTIFWLHPLLKAFISLENTKPNLTIYLFNIKILNKALMNKKSKTKGSELIKITNPEDIHVNAYYGFQDPFMTGIACGAANIASQFINIDTFNQNPDFLASNDYIYMDANAKVNIGKAMINFFKSRISK